MNRREQRDGPLFRGRYQAILVEADPYLLHVSRSLHSNPLEAGLTEPLERYRWSSYAAYVQCVRPAPWLPRHRVLARAGESPEQSGAFVQQAGDWDVDAFDARLRLPPILGGAAFRAQATPGLDGRHMGLAAAPRLYVPPTVAQSVGAVATSYPVKSQVLTDGGRPQGE